MIKNYKELKVWQKSYRLCLEVYRVTKGFPKEELAGDLAYIKNDGIFELQSDRGEVERMVKALIKSLENKHLNPRILESLTPFFQLIGIRPGNKGINLI